MTRGDIWTFESISVLREMAEDGYSFKEIAEALGPRFTKNACVGKARRLKIKWNSSPSPRMMARKPQPVVAPVVHKIGGEVFVPLATIETVTDRQCKFPLSEAHAQMPVCGRPRKPPSRYCEAHFRIAHNHGRWVAAES